MEVASTKKLTSSILPSLLFALLSLSPLFDPRRLIARVVVSRPTSRCNLVSCVWPLACDGASGCCMWPLASLLEGGLNVSVDRPARRGLLWFCRRATESSEPVRCLLRGLRVDTGFTCEENIFRRWASSSQRYMPDA